MNLYAATDTRLGRSLASTVGLIAMIMLAGCTEKLAIPGDCPALCPGGQTVVVDTVLDAIVDGDSTFTGYGLLTDGVTIQLANGGAIGEIVGVTRFVPGADSVFVADTVYPVIRDSVRLHFTLVERDAAATGLVIDFYRLPSDTDSLTSQDDLIKAMTPDRLLRAVSVPDDTRIAALEVLFEEADLDRLPFTPADEGRLVIGIRLRANQQGVGAYIGGASGGAAAPIWHTYGHIDIADTSLVTQTVTRVTQWQRSVYSDGVTGHDPDLLTVGGPSASRSFVRFALPQALRDSATIIRATLELVPAFPTVGITGDSVRVDVFGLLADFGSKSSVLPSPFGATWVAAGSDTVRVDIAPVVSLWQGEFALPAAVRVQIMQEYSSIMSPRFHSTRSTAGGPRLRVTYRRPFPFGGY